MRSIFHPHTWLSGEAVVAAQAAAAPTSAARTQTVTGTVAPGSPSS
jgi:hypothetical protein